MYSLQCSVAVREEGGEDGGRMEGEEREEGEDGEKRMRHCSKQSSTYNSS